MSKTTYMVQTIRDGKLQKRFFIDDEETAILSACVLIQLWELECDRVTWLTFVKLRRERKDKEAIRMWNEGRLKHQVYVFQITVDSPSELFERLARE